MAVRPSTSKRKMLQQQLMMPLWLKVVRKRFIRKIWTLKTCKK